MRGISGMMQNTVSQALKLDEVRFLQNKYNLANYFMLGDPIGKGWSPQQQKQQDAKKLGFMPHMPSDYFKAQANLKEAVSLLTKHFSPHPKAMSENATAGPPAGDNGARNETPFCQPTACGSPEGLMTGSCFQDIDLDHEWTSRVLKHGQQCRNGKLVPHDREHGSEVTSTYMCTFCKKVLTKWHSSDDKRSPHPGPKGSAVNLSLAHAIFVSGINVQKASELFAEAGIVCPNPKTLQELVEKVKKSVSDLSEETLQQNRKEHVAACRNSENYPGDLIYTDSNGKEHRIAPSPELL